MKYAYQEQEKRYQRLRRLGHAVDWAGASFEHFNLRPFLEAVLPGLTFSTPRPRALEYGTGTGPGACFLARCGFEVDAIDLCPTAIELARKFAAERGLDIHYEVQDIGCFSTAGEVYDLVVDNYCLQRLITDEQRRQALKIGAAILTRHGYFILGTTIYEPGHDFGEDRYDPLTGVVYRRLVDNSVHYEDAVKRDDFWFIPRQRRLRPEILKAELEQAGYLIVKQCGGEVLCRPRPGNPYFPSCGKHRD